MAFGRIFAAMWRKKHARGLARTPAGPALLQGPARPWNCLI
jgi:hypothetical protein